MVTSFLLVACRLSLLLFGTVYWQGRCRTSHRRGRYHYIFLNFFLEKAVKYGPAPLLRPPIRHCMVWRKVQNIFVNRPSQTTAKKIIQRSKSKIKFFSVCTKLAEMALLYSKDLTTANKLPPVEFNLMQENITGLGVQCLNI